MCVSVKRRSGRERLRIGKSPMCCPQKSYCDREQVCQPRAKFVSPGAISYDSSPFADLYEQLAKLFTPCRVDHLDKGNPPTKMGPEIMVFGAILALWTMPDAVNQRRL